MPSTWTTTLPQGTTKIRMLPNICQDRWTNIQQGEVPSTKWQLARRAGNPGAIPSSGLIFTKDGGAGTSELYYKDDASVANTVQLTQAGNIGILTQKVYASNIVMKPKMVEINNPQQAFCCAFGAITGGTGALATGAFNITSSVRNGTGDYTLTWNFTATGQYTYIPIITVRKLGSLDFWGSFIFDQQQTTLQIKTFRDNGLGSTNLADADFTVSVFGAFT